MSLNESPRDMELTLLNRVNEATKNLMPGQYYSLSIGGLALPRESSGRFERIFGGSLGAQTSASLALRYDRRGLFYPASIHIPIERPNAEVVLFHSQAMGYMSTIARFNKDSVSVSSPERPKVSASDLLGMLGIDQPPAITGDAYETWKDSLLHRSETWGLTEEMHIPEMFDDARLTTLMLRSSLKRERGSTYNDRSVTCEIKDFAPNEETGRQPFEQTTVEVTNSHYSRFLGLCAYTRKGSKIPGDPYDPEPSFENRSSITIDTESFPDLLGMASTALKSRRQLEH